MEYKVNDIITKYNVMSQRYELFIVKEVLKVVDSERDANVGKSILKVNIYSKRKDENWDLINENDVAHKVEILVNEREDIKWQ